MSAQTSMPLLPFLSHHKQWKEALVKDMVGKRLDELRTPSLIVDKTVLKRNCTRLSKITTDLNKKVRVHVKTHKVIKSCSLKKQIEKRKAYTFDEKVY